LSERKNRNGIGIIMNGRQKPSRKKILVVDGEPSVGGKISDLLLAQGYHPVVCNRPRKALEFSKRNRFCLAFVDINLPDINGLELAATLKARDPFSELKICLFRLLSLPTQTSQQSFVSHIRMVV